MKCSRNVSFGLTLYTLYHVKTPDLTSKTITCQFQPHYTQLLLQKNVVHVIQTFFYDFDSPVVTIHFHYTEKMRMKYFLLWSMKEKKNSSKGHEEE